MWLSRQQDEARQVFPRCLLPLAMAAPGTEIAEQLKAVCLRAQGRQGRGLPGPASYSIPLSGGAGPGVLPLWR